MSLNLTAIHADILAGLPSQQDRISHSRMNLDYYRGCFDRYRYRIADDPQSRNNRSSLLCKKVIDCMTSYLYRDDPVRTINGHKEATDFLQGVYKHNALWAKMQAADRLSMIGSGGAVAFQAAGTDDPKNPVKIHLWPDHCFAVYTSDDDPLHVEAVVTLDLQGSQDRYTLWTVESCSVYLRDDNHNGLTTGEIRLVESQTNPYGVLPFAFAHFESPVVEFWSGSPGNVLREVNDYVIYRLTELADAIKYLIFPINVVEGADSTTKLPRNLKPGEFVPLPAIVDSNGTKVIPKITPISSPLGFVAESWTDLQNYINHSLEMAGVPEAAIRMVQSVARSGSSIAAEQAPLVNYARGRQRPWLFYEANLAKMVLTVALAHLINHGVDRADLIKALDDFELSVRWSPYYSAIPGPERDRADAYSVANGYASKIQVLQEREGMTHDEAVARLKRVAEDQELEAEILPTIAQEPIPEFPDTQPVADSEDTQDEEAEGTN